MKAAGTELGRLSGSSIAVKSAGVKTCVCFECRFSSQFQTIKDRDDPRPAWPDHYGEVDYYTASAWYGSIVGTRRKTAGGSSFLSAGCHALDALLFCMGNDVRPSAVIQLFLK